MKFLDNYLKTADKNQKIMLVVIFFVLVGFLLNQFVSPMLEKQVELQESIDTMQLNLSKNRTKRLKRELSKKSAELLKIKESLEAEKDEINYIMSNVYKIRYSFFNDMRWANTLDKILKFSVDRNIKIESLKSNGAKDESKSIFKLKKNIYISGSGRYSNIVALIQFIENFETLIEFKSIEMKLGKDGVDFNIELNVYGVGL